MLISLPALFSLAPPLGIPLTLIFMATGARIGYKRRESDGFFYFTLCCSLALISILLYASRNSHQEERGNEQAYGGYFFGPSSNRGSIA